MAFKDEVGSLDRIAAALENMSGGGQTTSNIAIFPFEVDGDSVTIMAKAKSIGDALRDGKIVYLRLDAPNCITLPIIGASYGAQQSGVWEFAFLWTGEEALTLMYVYGSDEEYPTNDFSADPDSSDDPPEETGDAVT